MATREQLRKLSEKKSCNYLNFDESSTKGHVETHSGSIQMFRPNCGLHKVGRRLCHVGVGVSSAPKRGSIDE